MTEHDIQNSIRAALSPYGVCFRVNVGRVRTDDGRVFGSGLPPGFSDLLFIGQGFVAFIEVKTPNGRVSKAQEDFLRLMRGYGHRAGVARCVRDALEIIGQKI